MTPHLTVRHFTFGFPQTLTRHSGGRRFEQVVDMANASASMTRLPTEVRSATARQFRLITWVGFAYFLVIAMAMRLLPRSRRPSLPGLSGNRSVIAEARALTSTFIPFAFAR